MFTFIRVYFYPVYKLSDDGKKIIDVSIEAGGIVTSLVMLCIWALWCAVCEDPDPSVAVFVISGLALTSYLLLKARNFDDFSKLFGLDMLKLNHSCKESLYFHIHEFPPTVFEALKDGGRVNLPQIDVNISSPVSPIETETGRIDDATYNPFQSIKKLLAVRDQNFTSYVGRSKVAVNVDENIILLSEYDELLAFMDTLNRMFGMYRLKALKDAASERRLKEAEILNYIRTNIPSKSDLTIKELQKIPDFQMVKIMSAFKKWKDRRIAMQKVITDDARKEAEEAEKKRKEERRCVLVTNIMAARKREAKKRLIIDVANAESDRLRKQEAADMLRRQEEEKRRKDDEERQKALELALTLAKHRDRKKEVLRKIAIQAQTKCSSYVAQISVKRGSQQYIDREKICERIQNHLSDLDLCMQRLDVVDDDESLESLRKDIDSNISQLLLSEGELEAFDFSISSSLEDVQNIDNEENIVVTSFGVSTSMTLDEYLMSLKLENGKFKDPDFNTAEDSKRFTETDRNLETKINEHCLPPNPSPDDVKQGALGDCYYLSAIATIAERPELIQKLFVMRDLQKSIFVVKLFFNGSFRTVVVDDYFPFRNGSYRYAHGERGDNSRSLWVMLLEKAYAKLHGSFKSIEGGFESEAMADLTGGLPDITTPVDENMDALWGKLLSLNENNHLMGAVSF